MNQIQKSSTRQAVYCSWRIRWARGKEKVERLKGWIVEKFVNGNVSGSPISPISEGTTEYINAVREANDAALELIKNNHDLKYSVDDNGLINIDKKSLESAQKENAEKLL